MKDFTDKDTLLYECHHESLAQRRLARLRLQPRLSVKRCAVLLIFALLGGGCGHTITEPIAPPQPFDTARVRIVVPEVYELANIIIALTDYGLRDPYRVLQTTDYYQRMRAAFSPHVEHSSLKQLQLGGGDPLRQYYEFRENSFSYVFDGGQVSRQRDYGTIWNPNRFRERLGAVQKFADASPFRAFYQSSQPYYRELIARYRELVQVDSLADWLEREFAPRRFDFYTVVLSPLVYASHSSQTVRTAHGTEALMFVSGPEVTSTGVSAGVGQAMLQRVLFTEIDHSFVNPVTDQYRTDVERAFGQRAKWTTDASTFYQSPLAVFNEYMTWAVFILFIDGRLSAEDFAEVVRRTESQMEGSRRFQRFGAFNQELLGLYRGRASGQRVPNLYPAIIDWAGRQ
ncbi:MAG: DUF4932 domain-containing protein [Gemmatimonadota bacterium]